jgi:hypothetical protein
VPRGGFVHAYACKTVLRPNDTLPGMRVTERQTRKGKQGPLGVAKARRDGFMAVKGGSLAGL